MLHTQDFMMCTDEVYRYEVLGIRKQFSWMGIWSLHALSSLMNCDIWLIYPGNGAPRRHHDSIITLRQKVCGNMGLNYE